MTHAAMAERAIDPQRVYAVGTVGRRTHGRGRGGRVPELFAAVGIVEGAAYADGPCFTSGTGIPVETSAQLAFDQMDPGPLVPRFVTGSDADLAFPATCADKALQQGLRTNNLVLGDSQDGPID